MADFPATQNTGNLIKFIGEIGGLGIPDKLTTAKLNDYGYTSSHDRSIVSVLKGIDLLGDNGSPSELWREARTQPKVAVAKGVLSGYKSLYQTFPNAHERDNETLTNYFKSKTDVGDSTVKKIVGTFRALSEYADFSKVDDVESAPAPAAPQPAAAAHTPIRVAQSAGGMAVNLNIELTLPADETGKVYDAFFRSMKKHLIDASEE